MGLWDRIRELRLRVADLRLDALFLEVSKSFRRRTTVVVLHGEEAEGSCAEGRGEDVSYGAREHELFATIEGGLRAALRGDFTLEKFSERLDEISLFPEEPEQDAYRDYRRWAFESAAFDLALRQNGIGIEQAFERRASTLRFVVSMRLPEPPTLEKVERLQARYPSTRFKLDLDRGWDREFVRRLARTGVVDIIDFKGMYSGTPVDLVPDPEAYAVVVTELPDTWIEDPKVDETTEEALRGAWPRITWDAPLHSRQDVIDLEHAPRMLNSKPSRFGSWRRLLEFYEHCEEQEIGLYAGGQFELGVGRDQIQCLAALFHADAPNDCAPRGYNEPEVAAGLPESPWQLPFAPTGFGFAATSVEGL